MTSVTWSWKDKGGHHHESHTPTSPEAILLGKMAHHTKQIIRECTSYISHPKSSKVFTPQATCGQPPNNIIIIIVVALTFISLRLERNSRSKVGSWASLMSPQSLINIKLTILIWSKVKKASFFLLNSSLKAKSFFICPAVIYLHSLLHIRAIHNIHFWANIDL